MIGRGGDGGVVSDCDVLVGGGVQCGDGGESEDELGDGVKCDGEGDDGANGETDGDLSCIAS